MIGAPNLLPLLDLNLKSAPVPDSPPAFSLNNFLASGDIEAAATSPGKMSDLAAFGFSLNAASRSILNKDSILRLVTIDSPNGAYIVIRIEPVDERSGYIGERFLFDWSCVQIWINFMLSRLCTREGFFGRKKLDANFDRYEIPEKLEDDFDRYKIPEKLKRMLSKFERDKEQLNKSTLHWYENNIAKVNNKGGNIRLFSIHLGVPGLPEQDSVVNLAQYICAQINAVKINITTTRVDRAKLYWIPREECRWADILGWDGALRKLLRKTGPPTEGYFESNFSLIRSYFHKGTLPQQLGAFIRAPDEELHPMFRKSPPPKEKESDEENEDADDNSDARPLAEEAGGSNDDGASL